MSKPISLALAITTGSLITFFSTDPFHPWTLTKVSVLSLLIYTTTRALWGLYLYPFYFSPLLKLPQAPARGEGESFFIPPTPDQVLEWVDHIPNDGIIRYVDFLNQDSVTLTSISAVAEFLQTKADHFSKRPKHKRVMESVLGHGLVTAEGAEHKHQRKNIAPAFNFRVIKNLYPLLWSKSSEMVNLMRDEIKTESVVNVEKWAGRTSLDIIGKAGFGSDFDSLANPNTALNAAYRTSFTANKYSAQWYSISLLTHPTFMSLLPLEASRQVKASNEAVTAFITKFIDQNIFNRSKSEEKNIDKGSRKDIISAAFQSGGFTAQNLVDQSKTLMGAGHETSATAINWGIYILSRPENAHVQKKLREEIRANLPSPDSGEIVTAEILDKLQYLDAVSKEILRVRPPVPQIGRVAVRDTTICGQYIPKGTGVVVHSWALNRCKYIWGADARLFKPERWLTGDGNGGAKPLAYLTFGSGTRGCIGKGLAQGENKAVLAALIGRFEFSPMEDEKPLSILWAITARIVGGCKVNVKVIEGW
ncbi:hypothetical protein K3495_g2529 [Podosphaera aphanis]|nr:hypothetical protein K3495_g2529 [Podosphaera aphanis]